MQNKKKRKKELMTYQWIRAGLPASIHIWCGIIIFFSLLSLWLWFNCDGCQSTWTVFLVKWLHLTNENRSICFVAKQSMVHVYWNYNHINHAHMHTCSIIISALWKLLYVLKLICLRLFFQLLCSHSFQSAHTHASACFFICNKLNTFSDEFTMRDRFQILVILCKRHKRWNNRHRHTKCITIYGSSILFLFECTEIVYRETDGARAYMCCMAQSIISII